ETFVACPCNIADQRERILHVIEHATAKHQVEAFGAVPQIQIEIAEQEFGALHGERFLDDEAFQIRLDIRLDRENACGAKLLEPAGMQSLKRPKLQDRHAADTVRGAE